MVDPLYLLQAVQAELAKPDRWLDQRFEQTKRTTNTGVGAIGQLFIERLCEAHGNAVAFPENVAGGRKAQSPWDIEIGGVKFELKTATQDTSGAFQFNHIRYHRTYDALLCLGITPTTAHFAMWSAADVKTGKAGTLVSMEKGANASFKLTKRPSTLQPIAEFQTITLAFLAAVNAV
jgi:hypothetical protein